jgi:hypothetical protein
VPLHLTDTHVAILRWVERNAGVSGRPDIPHRTSSQIDRAVAELLLDEAITAVSRPRRHHDPPHWEPTGLTPHGRALLAQHPPEPAAPWWRQWLKR